MIYRMFKELTMNMDLFRDFKWDYKSEIEVNNQTLKIKALPCSDYFVDPADGKKSLNAPYYHNGQIFFIIRKGNL